MRLCRFVLDDLTLVGFFTDDGLIPIDQEIPSPPTTPMTL